MKPVVLAAMMLLSSARAAYANSCEENFDPGPQVEELVSWMSLTHPVTHSAIQHAKRMDFLFDLLQVPTGWMLPPRPESEEAFLFWSYSNRMELRWGSKRLLPRMWADVDAASGKGKRSDHFVERFGSAMVTRALSVLSVLATPNCRWVDEFADDLAFRTTYKFEMCPPHRGRQNVLHSWKASFNEAEYITLERLAKYAENPVVREMVERNIIEGLAGIVTKQQEIVAAVGRCKTPYGFRDGFTKYILSDSPALPAPVGPAPVKGAAPLDLGPVAEFVAEPVAPPLDSKSLWELRTHLPRALDLLSWVLGRVGDAAVEPPPWRTWRDELGSAPDDLERLSEAVIGARGQQVRALRRFRDGEHALSLLLDWVEQRRASLSPWTESAEKVAAASPQDQRTLRSILGELDGLSAVLGPTLGMLVQRQLLIDTRLSALTKLTLLSVMVRQQRLAGIVQPPALNNFRDSLNDLADDRRDSANEAGATPE